jgi:DNA helicase-2/ATP-dependent DNA helicase PcrA
VRHPQFGEGKVVSTSGSGSNARVTVDFRGLGKKTLVLEYARLRKVN